MGSRDKNPRKCGHTNQAQENHFRRAISQRLPLKTTKTECSKRCFSKKNHSDLAKIAAASQKSLWMIRVGLGPDATAALDPVQDLGSLTVAFKLPTAARNYPIQNASAGRDKGNVIDVLFTDLQDESISPGQSYRQAPSSKTRAVGREAAAD
jgi:hypothetical protein